jgi:hypothetical protein
VRGPARIPHYSLAIISVTNKLIGFYNQEEKCSQRGTGWVFKYGGLRFGFKWLSENKQRLVPLTA